MGYLYLFTRDPDNAHLEVMCSSKQWRSQECELGGSPPLPPPSLPLPLSPPLYLLTGVRGYNPGNLFEIKGARRRVLEDLGPQN